MARLRRGQIFRKISREQSRLEPANQHERAVAGAKPEERRHVVKTRAVDGVGNGFQVFGKR